MVGFFQPKITFSWYPTAQLFTQQKINWTVINILSVSKSPEANNEQFILFYFLTGSRQVCGLLQAPRRSLLHVVLSRRSERRPEGPNLQIPQQGGPLRAVSPELHAGVRRRSKCVSCSAEEIQRVGLIHVGSDDVFMRCRCSGPGSNDCLPARLVVSR